ncbi:phosphatase domain-containing protein [uncultured Polaribacter sp.]|uniref:App1 family protein n=1 Tax=uncultured Polaribacter sp. TaxID=174711 RepID=UPI00262ACB1D|nr:phosphatase domain-containing protein [uncultured Polaribacter sp.]
MSFFSKDPLQIIVFQSYGSDTHFYVRGRALQDENINLEKNNVFSLLRNTWKRFESDEVRNTSLTILLPNNHKIITKTDYKGYFEVSETLNNLTNLTDIEGWLNFEVSFTDSNIKRKITNNNTFLGKMLIPKLRVDYGIISDIDDTILHTGVISRMKWRVLINTFFVSPLKRKVLVGAAEFYNLLHLGKSGKNANPLFYVSHSPWNLYRYLDFFLEKNNFPKGAILLRTAGSIFKKKTLEEKPQKQNEIRNILKTYTDLKFILIGDAGEHDADIYMEITKNYPNRIKAIYLRSVQHSKKMERIKLLVENYNDTEFFIVDSSKEAIIHAKKHQFIA